MQFHEIAGQAQIKERLIQSVQSGQVSHAQLFSGTCGSGAFPLALAYARYLNCLNPLPNDSCGICSACVKTAKLVHPDLHFVFPVVKEKSGTESISDSKLNEWRSFVLSNPYFTLDQWLDAMDAGKKSAMIYAEESRSIITKLSYKNFEGKYKIMIIWLPERMHMSGANKILKILEEPFPQTLFLLVSENPAELLPTILSRTQQWSIPRIELNDLSDFIQTKAGVDASEAHQAARIAAGDCIEALNYIQKAESNSLYFELFIAMMRSVYSRKIFDIIAWVESASSLSRDKLKGYFDYAVGMLRESYIYNFKEAELNYLNAQEEQFVTKFAPFIHEGNIEAMSQELSLAHSHIEHNGNARIVLFDMAIKLTIQFKG